MNRRLNYDRAKEELLTDETICPKNRALWSDFFTWEERKLKRINNLCRLDDATYKTLRKYVGQFRNVNQWFNNKPWQDLSREDIQRVYDDLEDGVITNRHGKPYRDRKSYYTKIFKAKPFKLAGKLGITEEVFEFFRPVDDSVVNYISFSDFKSLTIASHTVIHRLLLWLAWDIGENIMSLLQLKKSDFRRQLNPDTQEPEYLVNLRKETLKRSRTPRVELTLFTDTVELLDVVLNNLSAHESLFHFGQRQAAKIIEQCVETTGVKCQPTGNRPTFKVLRSSMCCYLLKEGWRIEEVNARLGHSPGNLTMVTRYANYLVLDKHKPKKLLSDNQLKGTKDALNDSKKVIQRYEMKFSDQKSRIDTLEQDREQTNELIQQLLHKVVGLQNSLEKTNTVCLQA